MYSCAPFLFFSVCVCVCVRVCVCVYVCLCVQGHIEEKWADILLHIYYPALLSAFSLLILFWAEVYCSILRLVGHFLDLTSLPQIFYQSTPSENHVFLKKYKYSLAFFGFNALVYLLLLAEIIATSLVKDDTEQV